MKFICLTLILSICASCSFSGKEDEEKKTTKSQSIKGTPYENLDSDGDLILDHEEKARGLNPYVADVPKLDVNFLQDYTIKILYEDESTFELDTHTAKDDPDFKYRVGDLFLRENSLNNAAKLGRFSGVSWGDIKQQDFSWVKYPRIDEDYYFNKKREYSLFSEKKVREIEITLENSLKLKESAIYRSIEAPELNFYYYSHSKESYVLLHTERIENTFQAGVRDSFTVNILNPPLELIEDAYMRHGEFIISEVKDFYIPDLKVSYRDLLASVKAKTIPVYRTTPFENELNYVAVSKAGDSFINILSRLYPEKYEIRENQLTQVGQFSNNLPTFKYLHELAAEDKTGRWYVMTNPIKQHFLKHGFTNEDAITLSFATGDDLARRVSEVIPAYRENVFSGDSENMIPLGNISNNSELSLSLYLNALKGIELIKNERRFSYSPPSCKNCTGTNWNVWAKFSLNEFRSFEGPWRVISYEDVAPAFDLYINNTKLDLTELLEKNLASLSLKETFLGSSLNIHLKPLHQLNIIQSGQENLASLVMRPLSVGHAGEGIQVTEAGGKNIDKTYHAGLICLQQAALAKAPLAVTSFGFKDWQHHVSWNKKDPQGFTPKKGQIRKHYEGVSMDIISKITNFYN